MGKSGGMNAIIRGLYYSIVGGVLSLEREGGRRSGYNRVARGPGFLRQNGTVQHRLK